MKGSFTGIYLKKVNLIVCLFLFISSAFSQDQWEFTTQEQEMYKKLVEGNCDLPIITDVSPASIYLNNLQTTLNLLLIDNQSGLDIYEDNFDRHLKIIESYRSNNPYRNFFLAEIRLRAAFVYLKFDKQLESGWQFRQAFRLIKKNINDFPAFLPNYKTIGIMHILVGSVPEKYQWVLSLAGLNGSVKQGKDELIEVINANISFSHEALLLMALSEAYILQEPAKASRRLEAMSPSAGNLLSLAKMSIYIKNGQSESAIRLFNLIKETPCISQIYYMAAEANLQKGNYVKASELYSDYLLNYKGNTNLKDSYYKRYLCKYLSKDTTGSSVLLQQAKSIKLEITEADRYAGKIIDKEEAMNVGILKLRLATDGGFYETARKILNDRPPLFNNRDSVEIIYREARLEHKTSNIPHAITLYKLVISKSNNASWYFAPNSALMLGHLYAEQKEYKLAKEYYLKAKSYRHHEYKNSIDTKAEAGLNLIKDL